MALRVIETTGCVSAMIRNYELDCHVDVVLIGESFNSDDVAKVQPFLEDLSDLSFVGAPLPHVHEKLIYHISTAKLLEKKVLAAISNKVEQEEIISYFQEHHQKSGTGTTLYVLNFSYEKDSNVRYKWSTFTSATGFAWININNVFDSMASYVAPYYMLDNLVPPPATHTDRPGAFDMSGTHQELAVVIHRSIEQLLPSPLPLPIGPSSGSDNRVGHASFSRHLHVRLFTLCGFPLAKCQPDSISIGAVEALSTSFTNELVKTTYSSTLLRVTESTSVGHALLSALQTHSSPASTDASTSFFAATDTHKGDTANVNNWRNVSVLSADEFLYWMSRSRDVAAMLRADLSGVGEDALVVPVFSLLLPDEWNVVLSPPTLRPQEGQPCGNYRDIHIESEVSTSTGSIPASMISCGKFFMPLTAADHSDVDMDSSLSGKEACAVIVLRRDDLPPIVDPSAPSRRNVGRIPPALSTGLYRSLSPLRTGLSDSRGEVSVDRVKTPLMRSNTFEVYEMGDMILQVAWAMPPSYSFYSPSAQQMVTDFLWYDSLYDGTSTGRSGADTPHTNEWAKMYSAFRHSRILQRHMVMHRANGLVERSAVALARAAEIADTGSPLLLSTLDREFFPSAGKKQQQSPRGRSKSVDSFGSDKTAPGTTAVPDVVTAISRDMEALSIDYSHLEFSQALEHLTALEDKVSRLEGMTSFGGEGHAAPAVADMAEVYGKIACTPFDHIYNNGVFSDTASVVDGSSVVGGYIPLVLGLLIGAIAVLCLIRVNKGGSISIFGSKRYGGRRVVTR